MKCISKFLLVFLAAASLCDVTTPLNAMYCNSTVEFRTAVFVPTSSRFRHIYGNAGTCYELQANMPLTRCFTLWTNLDWFSRHGKSIGFENPTRVSIVNGSVGVNYEYCLNDLSKLYAGIGPSISGILLKNQSFCKSKEKIGKVGIGAVAKFGLYYSFTDCLFLDFFVDYLYQRVDYKKRNADISAVKPGVGIGVRF